MTEIHIRCRKWYPKNISYPKNNTARQICSGPKKPCPFTNPLKGLLFFYCFILRLHDPLWSCNIKFISFYENKQDKIVYDFLTLAHSYSPDQQF